MHAIIFFSDQIHQNFSTPIFVISVVGRPIPNMNMSYFDHALHGNHLLW